MNFNDLWNAWSWKPIRGCPGRYVLAAGNREVPLDALLGPDAAWHEFCVEAAKDVVLVAEFEDGGLITYRRANSRYVHTLNTQEGLERKLAQLGIRLPGGSEGVEAH